jgi:hypothetical protein
MANIHNLFRCDTASVVSLLTPQQSAVFCSVNVPVAMESTRHLLYIPVFSCLLTEQQGAVSW